MALAFLHFALTIDDDPFDAVDRFALTDDNNFTIKSIKSILDLEAIGIMASIAKLNSV